MVLRALPSTGVVGMKKIIWRIDQCGRPWWSRAELGKTWRMPDYDQNNTYGWFSVELLYAT